MRFFFLSVFFCCSILSVQLQAASTTVPRKIVQSEQKKAPPKKEKTPANDFVFTGAIMLAWGFVLFISFALLSGYVSSGSQG